MEEVLFQFFEIEEKSPQKIPFIHLTFLFTLLISLMYPLVFLYAYTHTHEYKHTFTCIWGYTQTCTCLCTHIYTHMYVYTHVYLCMLFCILYFYKISFDEVIQKLRSNLRSSGPLPLTEARSQWGRDDFSSLYIYFTAINPLGHT